MEELQGRQHFHYNTTAAQARCLYQPMSWNDIDSDGSEDGVPYKEWRPDLYM